MSDPFREQKIQNWAAEFAESDELRASPGVVREHAGSLAATFLEAACRAREVEPGELTEADLKIGLLEGAARLVVPAAVHEQAPTLCALFFEVQQQQGRVAAGRALPAFVRALSASYRTRVQRSAPEKGDAPATRVKGKPIVNPGSKLGLNDPCPCGSGLKYKKCCKRLLG